MERLNYTFITSDLCAGEIIRVERIVAVLSYNLMYTQRYFDNLSNTTMQNHDDIIATDHII